MITAELIDMRARLALDAEFAGWSVQLPTPDRQWMRLVCLQPGVAAVQIDWTDTHTSRLCDVTVSDFRHGATTTHAARSETHIRRLLVDLDRWLLAEHALRYLRKEFPQL